MNKIKGCTVLALPQSASRVLDLSKNPDNGPPEFALPISADPGLTAQILRFANSAFFGFPNKIATVQTALSLVSVRTIRNFILWNAVFTFLPNPKVGNFVLRRLIQDALRRAVFCKCIGSYCPGINSEEIFVAGLLQDVAIPILTQNFQKDYDRFFVKLKEESIQLSKLEQAQFGWNHSQV
ncbi:MAG: HDOD domain-containing protein, partial [Planctomycetaceae bacterium]|nr:HDOD domain-containing protein [Planctomycetaceae bacterium]